MGSKAKICYLSFRKGKIVVIFRMNPILLYWEEVWICLKVSFALKVKCWWTSESWGWWREGQTILCICNVNLMISSLNVLYITITIHLPDISIQTKTTNYAVKRDATSPFTIYVLFTTLFVFPTSLAIHISLRKCIVNWLTRPCHSHNHHVTDIPGAPTLMYVFITFYRKIVSILNRCWNLRQVINFEYKLCSVSRQILIVRMKYKIVFSNQI